MLNHYSKIESSQELLSHIKDLSKDEIIEVLVKFYESYYLESGGDDFESGGDNFESLRKSEMEEYTSISVTIKRTAINRLRNMVIGKSLMNKDRNSKIDKILGDESKS